MQVMEPSEFSSHDLLGGPELAAEIVELLLGLPRLLFLLFVGSLSRFVKQAKWPPW